ncbi:MAG: NADH-quinone oxidoreductase subunit NuoE [Mangrovicoccus sp.]
MLRRLHPQQPESFAFTEANKIWAEAQIAKYPEGRQASAVIPLLWRAQEQESWLSKPAIEYVADMLGMAYIRVLEVATFYFMFQLQPVGEVAHFQICGTTSCMLCGSEDLIEICKKRIAPKAHQVSEDGKFSWEEVECLGSCSNAPMAQIGKDYYEDLSPESFEKILDELAAGNVPTPGPQNGRYAAEPLGGVTSLKEYEEGRAPYNASATLALEYSDTVKRIDGTETRTPLSAEAPAKKAAPKVEPKAAPAKEASAEEEVNEDIGTKPELFEKPTKGPADDLQRLKGVGPKLENALNDIGVYYFAQIASWSDEEVAWVDEHLISFKGRITRDNWVEQAKSYAAQDEAPEG